MPLVQFYSQLLPILFLLLLVIGFQLTLTGSFFKNIYVILDLPISFFLLYADISQFSESDTICYQSNMLIPHFSHLFSPESSASRALSENGIWRPLYIYPWCVSILDYLTVIGPTVIADSERQSRAVV